MKILPLFATPVAIKNIELDNEQLKEFALTLQVSQGRIVSNRVGYQSNNIDLDSENLQPLISEINAASKQYCTAVKIRKELTLDNMWFNISNYGGFNVAHKHPGCILSGVYYVDVRETQGDLYVDNPNTVDYDWNRDVSIYEDISDNAIATNNWSFVPKEGDLYLFPSWAKHGVTPNTTKNNRISISFNLS